MVKADTTGVPTAAHLLVGPLTATPAATTGKTDKDAITKALRHCLAFMPMCLLQLLPVVHDSQNRFWFEDSLIQDKQNMPVQNGQASGIPFVQLFSPMFHENIAHTKLTIPTYEMPRLRKGFNLKVIFVVT